MYLNEYYILLFIYSVIDSGIITCEAGNFGSFTAFIVVRVEWFESV